MILAPGVGRCRSSALRSAGYQATTPITGCIQAGVRTIEVTLPPKTRAGAPAVVAHRSSSSLLRRLPLTGSAVERFKVKCRLTFRLRLRVVPGWSETDCAHLAVRSPGGRRRVVLKRPGTHRSESSSGGAS